jgi:hypothetical protein
MKSEKVPFMLSIPKKYRDQLRRLAAEQNYKNPDHQTFAATIATQVLCEYLEKLGAEQ